MIKRLSLWEYYEKYLKHWSRIGRCQLHVVYSACRVSPVLTRPLGECVTLSIGIHSALSAISFMHMAGEHEPRPVAQGAATDVSRQLQDMGPEGIRVTEDIREAASARFNMQDMQQVVALAAGGKLRVFTLSGSKILATHQAAAPEGEQSLVGRDVECAHPPPPRHI